MPLNLPLKFKNKAFDENGLEVEVKVNGKKTVTKMINSDKKTLTDVHQSVSEESPRLRYKERRFFVTTHPP